jgi:hypothetical protein
LSTVQLILLMFLSALLAFWSSFSFAIMSNAFHEQNSPGIAMDPMCLRSITSWTSSQAETDLYGSLTYWMVRGWQVFCKKLFIYVYRFYGLLGILYSYLIPLFCAYRILVNLKRQSYMFVTKKARSMQHQLNLIISLQASDF